MNIRFGDGTTQYGPGVLITLSGKELAVAVMTYLTSQQVYHEGPITICVDDELCRDIEATVYVDPSGKVVADGVGWSGRGNKY
jgi:hypothetical protein